MAAVTVFNRGGNPVEAAGRAWPPRRPTTVDLDDRELAAIARNRRLQIVTDVPDPTVEHDGDSQPAMPPMQERDHDA